MTTHEAESWLALAARSLPNSDLLPTVPQYLSRWISDRKFGELWEVDKLFQHYAKTGQWPQMAADSRDEIGLRLRFALTCVRDPQIADVLPKFFDAAESLVDEVVIRFWHIGGLAWATYCFGPVLPEPLPKGRRPRRMI